MSEQFYVMELDEPAAASFCSFSKQYFGTKKDIEAVIKSMEQYSEYEDTVAAWKEFQAGNRYATHSVAYSPCRLLRPAKFIASSEIELKRRKWEHTNLWGCPYPMKITGGTVTQVILKLDKKYFRCIRATLNNLKYESVVGEWDEITSLWGNYPVMRKDMLPDGHYTMSNLLYVIEDEHDTPDGLDKLIQDPKEIKFDKFCDEIFADG